MAQNPQTSDVNSALDNLAFGIANASTPPSPPRSTDPTASSFGAGPDNTSPASAASTDVLRVAAQQTELLKGFYSDVLNQSRSSFLAALSAAIGGFVIFIAGLGLLLSGGHDYLTVGTIGTVAGIIIQMVSSLLFYLYARTSAQLGNFHNRLLQVQRFLLANQLCDAIIDPTSRDTSRAALITVISGMTAPSEVTGPDLPQRPSGM